MQPAPRVTIGMPVYNGERFLREALDSLLAQTFTDFELVISDNASEDATGAICTAYAGRDSRVRYLRQDINHGAAWNHNRVVEEARGELFKLACYDYVCDPAMIAACVQALDRHPEAVLAYPRTRMMMRGDMSTLQEYTSDMELSSPSAAMRFGDLIDEAPPSFPLFGVVHLAALRKTPLFESYKASDRVVLVRLALAGPFVEAQEAVFYYRWHDNNATKLVAEPARFYQWWDPAAGSGRVFPETRLLYEYFRSLWIMKLSLRERRECAREIRFWYQFQKPSIKWELKGLLGRRRTAEPPRSTYVEQLVRRARRKQIKQRLYPLGTD
jgi:glycosyltransferase involved in cell wall biosynthesis